MYLFETQFKKNTPTFKALLKIAGIGKAMAIQTCERIGISRYITLDDLSAGQLARFNQTVQQNLLSDNEYRLYIKTKIKHYTSISSYRGFRHFERLPCRGQRTHTNASTSRKRNRVVQKNKNSNIRTFKNV